LSDQIRPLGQDKATAFTSSAFDRGAPGKGGTAWWIVLSEGIVVRIGFDVVAWYWAIAMGLGGYVVLESAFRRRLTLVLTLVLAAAGGLVLLWEFRLQAVLALLVGVALLILSDNVRELRRR
jgi:hypothetical protein